MRDTTAADICIVNKRKTGFMKFEIFRVPMFGERKSDEISIVDFGGD